VPRRVPLGARRILRRVVSCGLALSALASVTPALARQEFYDALVVGTGTCADCRLCHTGPIGNKASLDPSKPFLAYMIGNSRTGMLPDPAQDSDGDGATDLVELQEFGDPNDRMILPGQFECPTGPTPEYGCARIAPEAPSNAAAVMTFAAFTAFFLLRRRAS
jgi:hypothetical protein